MDQNKHPQEYFSISEGGLFHSILVKTHLNNSALKQIVAILCITWLPLLVITAFEGTIYSGVKIPFLKDAAIQMRLLVALPVLLIIKYIIDAKALDLEKYFSDTLMTDNDQQFILNRELHRMKRLASSAVAEIVLLLIVIVVTISPYKGGMITGTASWVIADGRMDTVLSFAGKWAHFISIPVFQFLILRWLWRYIIWALFLFRLSRTRLNLQPNHPDQAGGLGIVADVQKYFGLIFLVVSILASGEFMKRIMENPDSFSSIRGEAIGYITICVIIIFLPLFFFTGKLIKTRHKALIDYGNLGASLSNKFNEEWVGDIPIEKKASEGYISTSTLQDYSTVYRATENMRYIPFKLSEVILVTFILFIPYVPILVIRFSIIDLLQRLFGLLV